MASSTGPTCAKVRGVELSTVAVRIVSGIIASVTLILLSVNAAATPATSFTPIVDGVCPPAAFDGQTVAFITGFTCAQLWAVNPDGSGFAHLADSDLSSIVRVVSSNGTVVFNGGQAGHIGLLRDTLGRGRHHDAGRRQHAGSGRARDLYLSPQRSH